jgi:sugar phosphate permease
VFLGFGISSMLWLVPWRAATRGASASGAARAADDAPSFLAILRRRDLWGTCLGHFCGNYAFYFVISWLPLYLVKARGLTVGAMATVGGLVYVAYAASSMLTGVASDRLVSRGASATTVRKVALVASSASVAASLAFAALASATAAIACLFVAAAGFGLASPNVFAVGQTLAGPRAAGKWTGIQNCAANLAGVLAPLVTGAVVDRTGQFVWAFVVAGVVSAIGALGWGLVVRRVEPLDWSDAPPLAGEAKLHPDRPSDDRGKSFEARPERQ